MSKLHGDWMASLRRKIEPVGQCHEWQGAMRAKTPVVYVSKESCLSPSWSGLSSVRRVIYALDTGKEPDKKKVIRMKCMNSRCVSLDHMELMTRGDSVREQSRRGELSTLKATAAKTRVARERPVKLSVDAARDIRTSGDLTVVLMERYGVSRQTITAVKRGELWKEAPSGSSVFSWRPAA